MWLQVSGGRVVRPHGIQGSNCQSGNTLVQLNLVASEALAWGLQSTQSTET